MKTLSARIISFIAAIAVLIALVPQTANAASTGTSDFVTRFYQLCLSRTPDAGGLQNWVSKLEAKQLTGSDVANGFVNSPEFIGRNVSNDEYVRIMYQAFFNRAADTVGYNNWMDALNGGLSRYYVLAGFTNSQEFINLCASFGINSGSLVLTDPLDMYPKTTAFVIRFYRNCLGREADPAGLRMWVTNLQSGAKTGCDVAYGFAFSNEFLGRNLSNTDFINTMYAAFFNRTADTGGFNSWAKYLDAGYTRQYVLAGYVNSQEFKNLCATYGINPGTLGTLVEDSSLSAPLTCYFTRDVNGFYSIKWTAMNTSGKTMGKMVVYYKAYDAAGNLLTFTTYNSTNLKATYTGSCVPFDGISVSSWLGKSSGTIVRMVIGEITLEYSDGSSQTIQYNREVLLKTSASLDANSDSQYVEFTGEIAE